MRNPPRCSLHSVRPTVANTESPLPAPIVLVAEELSPAGIAQLEAASFEVRYADGADRAALLPALAEADAVIVRSATRIDAEALAHGPRLRVVARAGVGLDNVDIDAATKAGVMVVNAPTSNITSAAEHAIALLLAVARNVPQAAASLQGRAVEPVRVHRRRAAGQGGRHPGPGPDRRAGRRAAGRVRHAGHRLRPVPGPGPGRAAGRPPGQPGRAARRVRLHQRAPAEERRDRGPDRRPRAGPGQARGADHQRRPGRHPRRGRRWPWRSSDGRVARRGHRRVRHRAARRQPAAAAAVNVVATPHLGASTAEAQEKAGHPGGQVGPAGAGRRVRARRGQRPGRPGGRDVKPGPAAGREARPRSSPRWPAASRPASTSRCAARSPRRTSGCCSWPRSRACSAASSRTRSPT